MKKLLLCFLVFTNVTYMDHVTIFAHGIVDNSQQVNRFKDAINTPSIQSISFPDSLPPLNYNPITNLIFNITSNLGKNMNLSAMFMGQKEDISALNKEISRIIDSDKIVLFGCSRGAATILSCLGQHNPENIMAVVLDACPANIPETIQMKLATCGINPNYCDMIFSYIFPGYDPLIALTPIDAISSIQNKDLPILLIHSTQDKLVDYTNSLKLYLTFINAGFTNVHLALLPQGKHSFLLQNESIKTSYLNVVHSFYKKYELPYNPVFAQSSLEDSLMTLEKINSDDIEKYQNQITETYDASYQRNIHCGCVALIAILALYLL